MKKLGFGMMRLPLLDENDAGSVDLEQVKEMVDIFLERGFTYFDTAWMYCGFNSENTVKDALVDRYPREAYSLATKLHSSFIETKEDRDHIFNQQLEKTGVSYFDYYLIHGIEAESYEKYEKLDCFTWLQNKKKQGAVKHIGFSFHDSADLLDEILTKHAEVEFVQLQINYLDWDSEWVQSKKCYDVATKHGKQVIVMEPVKGGTLAKLPAEAEQMFYAHCPDSSIASWAVRFAASLPNVMMVLSGMSDMEQLLDNTSYMNDLQPLNEEEFEIVRQVVNLINSSIAIPCTGCAYCIDGCPKKIAIPKYFSLYNTDMRDGKKRASSSGFYKKLTMTFGKASECIACGQCENVCPQHLPIIASLKDVAAHYEI